PSLIICSFFFRTLRHPSSTLFPYTTLFRSSRGPGAGRESISWAGSRRPSRDGHRALENRVTYAKAFFDLQLQFAHKVTRLSGLRSEEHTSELQSRGHLVCRLLLEKKKKSK